MEDEIVKVKKSDLEAIINANTEAYNLLDEITLCTSEVEEKVRKAHSTLESVPNELDGVIVKEEE